MKTMFVINPVSGKRKGAKGDKIIRYIDREYRKAGEMYVIRVWDQPDRIDLIVNEAIEGNFQVIVAAGGDGTINEIGRRLMGTEIALGVLPMGSGNGYARHLGYSRKYKKAVQQILRAEAKAVDAGEFGGFPFMNNAGIGIDAEVIERFAQSETRGFRTYVRLATKAILSYKPFDVSLTVDGVREYEWKNLLLIDIANGTQWGNGAKVSPLSDIQDGYLEAVVLQKTPFIEVPRLVKLLFTGKIYRHPNVRIVRGKTFEIRRMAKGNAHVDGEAVILGETIQAQIHEKSVRLLIPTRRAKG
ncbi:MAG: diacylglycerol kinase family protein [Bacteroidota bacterium]